MKIILVPISSDRDTLVSVDGLILTVDGTPYDLSAIPEGGEAEAEIDGPFEYPSIVRRDEVRVLYRYDSRTAEFNQSPNIADYTFDIVSGPVPDPIVRKP